MKDNKKRRSLTIKGTPIINISEEVHKKIEYLCEHINTVEWSGLLFYTANGNITTPDSLLIDIKDIYLMDIGTGAATAFNYDSEVIADAFIAHPEYIENEYRMGLIHSHVNMGVFFSGEDISELEDNVDNYDYYLSLVVNNKMNKVAKIVFPGKEQKETKFKRSFKDILKNIINIDSTETEEVDIMFTIDCTVISDVVIKNTMEEYDERIKNIKAAKVKTTPKITPYFDGYGSKYSRGYDYDRDSFTDYKNESPFTNKNYKGGVSGNTFNSYLKETEKYTPSPTVPGTLERQNYTKAYPTTEKFIKLLVGIKEEDSLDKGILEISEQYNDLNSDDLRELIEISLTDSLDPNDDFEMELFKLYYQATGKLVVAPKTTSVEEFKTYVVATVDYLDSYKRKLPLKDRSSRMVIETLNNFLEDFVELDKTMQ
jgi:hypothetical protein